MSSRKTTGTKKVVTFVDVLKAERNKLAVLDATYEAGANPCYNARGWTMGVEASATREAFDVLATVREVYRTRRECLEAGAKALSAAGLLVERVCVWSHYDWSDGESDSSPTLTPEQYADVMDRLGLPHSDPQEWSESMTRLISEGWKSVPERERGFGSGQHNLMVSVPLKA